MDVRDHKIMNQNIPTKLLELAASARIFDLSEAIGKELGLHIDQIGELDAQVREVLRGRARPDKFTEDIQKYLEIDPEVARQITALVNERIFATIREELKSQTSTDRSADISSVERAGNFQIERPEERTAGDISTPSNLNINKLATVPAVTETFTAEDAPQMPPAPATPAPDTMPAQNPAPIPPSPAPAAVPTPRMPLVEEMMRGPTAVPAEKVEQKSADLYREPIE